MSRRAPAVICAWTALTLVVTVHTPAQSIGTHLRNSGGDIWATWTSPVHGTGQDWMLVGATVGGSAALSLLDAGVDRWIVRHLDHTGWKVLNPVREGGAAFSGRTVTPVIVGALAVALASGNERMQEGVFGCLAAYATTSAVRNYVAYRLVARTRPDSGRGASPPAAAPGDQYDFGFPGSSSWGRHSFPAGHVANVAGCGTFLTQRFTMGAVVEPVIYTVIAGVGIGRMRDRRHWLSDTALGVVLGWAVGREIALRSGARANRAAASPR